MFTPLRLVVASWLVLGALAGFASAADLSARIDELVGMEMARQKIPGVAVAVLQKGEVVHAKGYGLANVEHRIPVTADTLFQSGSVGKQFTAALALKLIEEEKLALTDAVTKFFPEAPAAWRDITVRHLLTHTSGIPDYGPSFDFQRNITEDELAKYAFGLKLESPAGARWNYSNSAYVLLGLILQRAGGQPYAEMMRDRIFLPAGMKTARGVISDADIVPHRAAGYHVINGELKNQKWVAPTLGTTADGCIYFSLNDVVGWEKAWRDRTVIKPESWTLLVTPVRLNSGRNYPYGFGIQIDETAGRKAERHGGAWQGFTAYRVRYVDDDFSVFVLANLSPANPGGIGEGVARVVEPRLKNSNAAAAPIPKEEPAVAERLIKLLADARDGKLSPDELAYVRGGSDAVPMLSKRYSTLLAGLAAPQATTLKAREEAGDDVIYSFEVAWPERRMLVRLGLAPDGKVSAFNVSPAR